MTQNGNAPAPLIRRAMQIEEEARCERLRAADAMRDRVEAFTSDPGNWREYLRTLADYPGRKPDEVVDLTRYRLALGLARMPRIMSAEEMGAAGRAPRGGSEGVELTVPTAMGPTRDKTAFFAVEDTVAVEGAAAPAVEARDRRVDTTDPAAMDAFVAAAGRCDLDSLTAQAEYAVSICYGLDFEDDPVPPPPPAETAAELYDALERIGRSVAEVQKKIDGALSDPARARRGLKKGARPTRANGDGAPRGRDPKAAGRRGAEGGLGPKAPTRDELCAMSADDVARAARDRRKARRA